MIIFVVIVVVFLGSFFSFLFLPLLFAVFVVVVGFAVFVLFCYTFSFVVFNDVVFIEQYLGKDPASKSDEFLKNSKRPLAPPPSFLENYVANFL